MEGYTSKELDNKIHTFLARKMKKYPELSRSQLDINTKTETHHQKVSWLHTFIPTQLKPSL